MANIVTIHQLSGHHCSISYMVSAFAEAKCHIYHSSRAHTCHSSWVHGTYHGYMAQLKGIGRSSSVHACHSSRAQGHRPQLRSTGHSSGGHGIVVSTWVRCIAQSGFKRFQARSDTNQESRCPIAHPSEAQITAHIVHGRAQGSRPPRMGGSTGRV